MTEPREGGRSLCWNAFTLIGTFLAVVALVLIGVSLVLEIGLGKVSPYIGILTDLVYPGVLLAGLLTIPAGYLWTRWRLRQRGLVALPPLPVVDLNARRTQAGIAFFGVSPVGLLTLLSVIAYFHVCGHPYSLVSLNLTRKGWSEGVKVIFFPRRHRTRIAVLGILLLWAASTIGAGEAEAKHGGGRFGGRSGFSRRTFPTAPSAPGRYAPYPRRGFPERSYGSPGFFPFPLFIPFGGRSVGFGGLGTLLVLGIGGFILFVMINDIMVRRRGGQGWRGYGTRHRGVGTQTVAMLQLALLATGRPMLEEIRAVARSARTDTPEGLAQALSEVAVLLGRQPEVWSAARWVVDRAEDLEAAEARLGEWSARERVKVSREAFVNIEGQRREATPAPTESWGVGAGFVVTIIVAVGRPVFDTIERPTQEDLSRILRKLAGLPPSTLLGLEVLWVPEPPTEPLTEEELLMQYPELQPL